LPRLSTLPVFALAAAFSAAGCASAAPVAPTAPIRPSDPPDEEVVRATFRVDEDLGAWRIAGGDWRVEDGAAVGTQLGDADAYLTWPVYFGSISSVVVRGRIVSKENTNFRVAVGDVAALLNWEMRPVNVFHQGFDVRKEAGPRALSSKRDHEIRFDEIDGRIVVRVDGSPVWETRGRLRGTVTIYPAVGSTIRVRDVEIRGAAVPWIKVDGPSQRAP